MGYAAMRGRAARRPCWRRRSGNGRRARGGRGAAREGAGGEGGRVRFSGVSSKEKVLAGRGHPPTAVRGGRGAAPGKGTLL